MEKKLPPYGQYLANMIKSGFRPRNSVYLFCGKLAWKKAEAFQTNKQKPATLCLPPYHDPSQYFWPVTDCDILVFDTSWCPTDYLEDIAYELLLSSASIVRIVNTDQQITVYKKDLTHEQKDS